MTPMRLQIMGPRRQPKIPPRVGMEPNRLAFTALMPRSSCSTLGRKLENTITDPMTKKRLHPASQTPRDRAARPRYWLARRTGGSGAPSGRFFAKTIQRTKMTRQRTPEKTKALDMEGKSAVVEVPINIARDGLIMQTPMMVPICRCGNQAPKSLARFPTRSPDARPARMVMNRKGQKESVTERK